MKALTVQQPWAWAIIHGGKDVENRTQLWKYRGPLAIHAGARLSRRGCDLLPDLLDATQGPRDLAWSYATARLDYGAIIGVVDVVDTHRSSDGCCDSAWAEEAYTDRDGDVRSGIAHLVLANPVELDNPVPAKGRLGLWTPDPDTLLAVTNQIRGDR